jgi:hypothetical protein
MSANPMHRLYKLVASLVLGAAAPLIATATGAATPLIAAAATVVTAPSATAKPSPKAAKVPLKAIEQAIEASAGGLALPADAVGNLVVTACDKCTPVSLLVTTRSQYFLKRTPVQLAELRRAIAGRPEVGVVVFYDANTRELTRLTANVSSTVLSSTPSAAGAK